MNDEQILYEITKRNGVIGFIKKKKQIEIDINIYGSAKKLAYALNCNFNVFVEIALKNLVWEFEHHKKALEPDPKKLFS